MRDNCNPKLVKTESASGRPRLAFGAAVTFGVLLAGGIGQRWLERTLVAADAVAIPLKQPLSSLPLCIGAWQGTEIPLDKRVVEVAGSDDYVSRRYVEEGTGKSVDLYVSYAARPAKMLSHRPDVCYVAHGWTHAETRKHGLDLPDGRRIECLLHRFTRQEPTSQEVVVLNYYILRGRYTADWTDFWGPKWRLPNLARDPRLYVAQVQVSTVSGAPAGMQAMESTVTYFAALVGKSVEKVMPDAADGGISVR